MKAKLGLLVSLAMLLGACGGGEKSAGAQSVDAPASNGNVPTYRVAIEPIYPPFVMQSPQGQEGFDVDLLNAIAEKEGFKVTYNPTTWSTIFDLLPKGEADIIAGGLTIAEDRKQFMDFTEPYYENATVLVVGKNSTLQNFAEAKGKKIAYQKDTSSVKVLKEQLGEPDKKLGFDSAWLGVKSVMQGEADAMIGESGALGYYTTEYKSENLRIIPDDKLPKEQIAFAVKKGNTELLGKLNKGLSALKADGTYDKLKQKWIDGNSASSQSASDASH